MEEEKRNIEIKIRRPIIREPKSLEVSVSSSQVAREARGFAYGGLITGRRVTLLSRSIVLRARNRLECISSLPLLRLSH
jgi:hypothetical protein